MNEATAEAVESVVGWLCFTVIAFLLISIAFVSCDGCSGGRDFLREMQEPGDSETCSKERPPNMFWQAPYAPVAAHRGGAGWLACDCASHRQQVKVGTEDASCA